jgi:hypothetical protein
MRRTHRYSPKVLSDENRATLRSNDVVLDKEAAAARVGAEEVRAPVPASSNRLGSIFSAWSHENTTASASAASIA